MLSNLFNFLAEVKAAVEEALAKFPMSGTALATLAAWALSRFGFHATVGTVETIVGAVLVIISALTAHSVRKAKLAAAK
jgi:hypothetical protein